MNMDIWKGQVFALASIFPLRSQWSWTIKIEELRVHILDILYAARVVHIHKIQTYIDQSGIPP